MCIYLVLQISDLNQMPKSKRGLFFGPFLKKLDMNPISLCLQLEILKKKKNPAEMPGVSGWSVNSGSDSSSNLLGFIIGLNNDAVLYVHRDLKSVSPVHICIDIYLDITQE